MSIAWASSWLIRSISIHHSPFIYICSSENHKEEDSFSCSKWIKWISRFHAWTASDFDSEFEFEFEFDAPKVDMISRYSKLFLLLFHYSNRFNFPYLPVNGTLSLFCPNRPRQVFIERANTCWHQCQSEGKKEADSPTLISLFFLFFPFLFFSIANLHLPLPIISLFALFIRYFWTLFGSIKFVSVCFFLRFNCRLKTEQRAPRKNRKKSRSVTRWTERLKPNRTHECTDFSSLSIVAHSKGWPNTDPLSFSSLLFSSNRQLKLKLAQGASEIHVRWSFEGANSVSDLKLNLTQLNCLWSKVALRQQQVLYRSGSH